MIVTMKRLVVLGMIFAAVSFTVFGQSSTSSSQSGEMSVEESYLQQSVELMIIREQSRATSLDSKLLALEYIGDAIDNGNTGEEIQQSLEYLALEGIVNESRENGRLLNNYPEVRVRAAKYLGDLGTAEAKDTLMKLLMADREPMVLTETVKSLGNIGINDDEETVEAIAWIVTRFDVLVPNDLLALSALDAFEKLSESSEGPGNPSVIRTILRIADGNYVAPVRNKARTLLDSMRKNSSTSN
jgi:hypothetical protein